MTLPARLEQFIRERQYLKNVSDRTVEYYRDTFRWMPNDAPTEDELKEMVLRVRSGGMKATLGIQSSCSTFLPARTKSSLN